MNQLPIFPGILEMSSTIPETPRDKGFADFVNRSEEGRGAPAVAASFHEILTGFPSFVRTGAEPSIKISPSSSGDVTQPERDFTSARWTPALFPEGVKISSDGTTRDFQRSAPRRIDSGICPGACPGQMRGRRTIAVATTVESVVPSLIVVETARFVEENTYCEATNSS